MRYSFDKNGNENFDNVKQKELQQCGYEKERLYSFDKNGKNENFDNVKQKLQQCVARGVKALQVNFNILETKYLNSHNDLHSRPP